MYEYRALITSVYDGDTFRANVDLGFGVWIYDQAFRLNRIQAPELSRIDPAGIATRDALRLLTPVDTWCIVRTVKDKTEKYGRMLADVYIQDNKICVNDLLVQKGLAKYWDGTGPRP